MDLRMDADRFANKLIFLFRIFGCWKQPNTWLYLCYSTTYLFIFSALSTFFMFMYLLNMSDPSELTYSLYMFLTQFCGFIKFVVFCLRNDRFQKLVNQIKEFKLESDDEAELVSKRINFIFNIACFYFGMSMIAIQSTGILAFISSNPKLPFSAWYPFLNWRTSTRDYVIAAIYQLIAVTSCILNLCTIDLLFALLLYIVSIRIEIIGRRMKMMGQFPNKQNFEIDGLKKFVNNIVLHQKSMDLKDEIENCFDLPFFFQLIASGIVISSIVNEVAKDTQRILPNTFGAIALTTQIFIPCFFANKVLDQSSQLSFNVYKSNWMDLISSLKYGRNYKHLYIITMERLKRDTIIMVGIVFPLSLSTFVSIINIAYRLYAVL